MNQTLEVFPGGILSWSSLLASVPTSLILASNEPRVYLLYLQSGLVAVVSVERMPSLVVMISLRFLDRRLTSTDYCLPFFFSERTSVSVS